jgi:D-methionine transport system substrate-binding protein
MKKNLLVVLSLVLALAFTLAACGEKKDNAASPAASAAATAAASTAASPSPSTAAPVTLKIGATAVPHAELLEHVKAQLAKEGVNLEIKVFTDYVLPNTQVAEKQLDANFFQHVPYLDEQNKARNLKLVKVAGIHIEPFGVYSSKIKKLDELKDGAKVAIPNDPSNGGRALALLEKAGLIKLKDGVGISGTVKDIVENKKNLRITEQEAAMLPRVLSEVDIATINTNYALEAKLVPTKDALVIEQSDSPYVNIIVAREDNKDSEALKKLVKALQTEDVKKFINEKYQGAVVPAFN